MMKSKKLIATLVAMMTISSVVGLTACGENKDDNAADGNAIVALDVNPSLELEVNEREEVEEVHALNEEAEIVLGDMDLVDVDLDVAVNAIIGSMLQNGYLSAEQNSILISVDADDLREMEALKESVSGKVSELLDGSNIEASVITQSFEKEHVKHKAEKDNISAAKATLIDKIIAAGLVDIDGVPYTYDELVGLKVYELKLMLESKGIEVEGIETKGEAGKGKFIGKDAALEIAYEDANVIAEDVVDLEIEMDFDKRAKRMSYEIEFETATIEYEYEINAVTGEIIESESEAVDEEDDDDDRPQIQLPEGAIDEATALAAAYARAEVTAEDVTDVEVELKAKREFFVYCIEFEVGETEYKCAVDAMTGNVLHLELEKEKGWHGGHGHHGPAHGEVPETQPEGKPEDIQPPVEEGTDPATETTPEEGADVSEETAA